MAAPANAAVRERKQKSSPEDLGFVNYINALTAAEHSRRQFVLNYAATRDKQLIIPGKKSDAVKAAEEWAAWSLSQSGNHAPDHGLYKYTVDARLWTIHGLSWPLFHPAISNRTQLAMTSSFHLPSCTARPIAHPTTTRTRS